VRPPESRAEVSSVSSSCWAPPPRREWVRLLPSAKAPAARGRGHRAKLEAHAKAFHDLRTQADLRIRRGDRVDRLTGVLSSTPAASLRSPRSFGHPSSWSPPMPTRSRSGKSPAARCPRPLLAGRDEALLGLALGPEELVALLAGHALPPRDPRSGKCCPPMPSVVRRVRDEGRAQRIWLDPTSGAARQVE